MIHKVISFNTQDSKLNLLDFGHQFNSSLINVTVDLKVVNDEIIVNAYYKPLVDFTNIMV
jgi:hypothetical protein